jgi:cytochrome c oxidase assembly factor 7
MILRAGKDGEIPRDGPKALELFEQGCNQDFRNGCFMASVMLLNGEAGVGRDMPMALQYALRACDLQHTWGCANAARMLETGASRPPEPTLSSLPRSSACVTAAWVASRRRGA